MTQCCDRRREDGVVDREAIERAVAGQPVSLSPTELRMAILVKAKRHGTGLNGLAAHFNYARSSVAEILAAARERRP